MVRFSRYLNIAQRYGKNFIIEKINSNVLEIHEFLPTPTLSENNDSAPLSPVTINESELVSPLYSNFYNFMQPLPTVLESVFHPAPSEKVIN